MKISILIAVYNAESTIAKCLQSALNQSYKNMEILVCDDGSTDKSKKIIKTQFLNDIILIENNKNLGVVKARNKLLKISNGDLITFLDSDDTIEMDRNKKFVDEFKKNNNLILCGSNFNFKFENNFIRKSNVPIDKEDIFKNKIYNSFLGASICFRLNNSTKKIKFRNIFNNKCYEDVDFILQLASYGHFKNLPDHLYNYNYSEKKLLSNINNYNPNIYVMRELIIFLFKNNFYFSKYNKNKLNLNLIKNLIKEKYKKYDNNLYKYNLEISMLLRVKYYLEAYKKFIAMFIEYPFSKITYKNFLKVMITNKFTYKFLFNL